MCSEFHCSRKYNPLLLKTIWNLKLGSLEGQEMEVEKAEPWNNPIPSKLHQFTPPNTPPVPRTRWFHSQCPTAVAVYCIISEVMYCEWIKKVYYCTYHFKENMLLKGCTVPSWTNFLLFKWQKCSFELLPQAAVECNSV